MEHVVANGYPDPAIGYWPERCLGHVYMVPEPVGSTHLRFGDARVVMGYVYAVTRMLFGVPDEIPDSRGVPEWFGGKELYIGSAISAIGTSFGGYRYCTGTTERCPGVHRVGPPAPVGLVG